MDLRGLDLTHFQFGDSDIRLEVLLSGAARRADRSRVRELFKEARTGLRLGKRPGLARAMAAAAGLGGVWADGAEGYRVLGGFLDDCLQLELIQGGPWCAMLESLAPKCSASVAAWLDHLREANPAGRSRLVAGLMDFIVAKGQLAGREWAPLVEPILEQLNRPEQEELGPQIVLAWRTLGDRQRAQVWLKRLTDQHGMRFRDRVSIRLSLHDLERGECGTARRWLEELAEEGRGRLREADPVRMGLAKALAGRLPVEAGQILASLVEEEARRGLAGDLLREPGFAGAAGNLERLMQILGTDSRRFHELLDRLLREHPESEWVTLLRRELAPPAMAGITEALAELLEDPRLADRMTRKDLQGLRAGLQGQADWANTALREGLLAVLVHRRLLKPADSEEMRQEWNLPGSIEVAGENL